MKRLVLALVPLAVAALPAQAAVIFDSTFENLSNGPSSGHFVSVQHADGWDAVDADHPIELQNHVAGDPAPDGGNVFVELDSTRNSSMSRAITAGTYELSFLYSPRPNVNENSNGIQIWLGNTLLTPPGTVTQDGGSSTSWSTISSGLFTVDADTLLSFKAVGTSDSFGGYVDNITLSAVPEPATWGLMLVGFGLMGAAIRRRNIRTVVRFA